MSKHRIKSHEDQLIPYYRKLTYDEKMRKNAEWIEDSINHIDRFSGYTDIDYLTKIDVNIAIAKGRSGIEVFSELQSKRNLINSGGVYNYNTSSKRYRKNFDILSPIYRSMVGEQKKRNLEFTVKDLSPYTQNLYKKTKLELYQEWTNANIVSPIREQVTLEIMSEYGIQDFKDLNPEEQEEVQNEIEQKTKFKTPKDIDKFMREDYHSPTETQLQEILNWYVKENDLKFKTDEAFKHLILTGREISYQTIQNKRPYFKIVNPKGFKYLPKANSFFIDEAVWWTNEEFVSYPELISGIPQNDKIIKAMHEVILSHGIVGENGFQRIYRGEAPGMVNEGVAMLNNRTDGAFLRNAPKDMYSPEGQSYLSKLYAMFGNSTVEDGKIRLLHCCYETFERGYLVQRYDQNKDQIKEFWVGENYSKNHNLDISVTEYWFPAYYEGKKIGSKNNLIYDKKRCEFQNRSVTNPWDIVSPYTGVEFSKLFADDYPVAPIDYGKSLQEEYNEVKEKIKELDETNIGRVFALPESFIPENFTYEQFVKNIKKHKIIPINENNSSLNPAIAAQILKSIDMTNNNDISGYQNRLQAIKKEAEEVMCYSPSALGQAPASITATTNQQNVIQTSYKTEDIYSLHDMFVTRTLQRGLVMLRNAITNNDDLKDSLLSIPTLAALEVDTELLIDTIPFIKVVNTTEDIEDIKQAKSLIQPMIQNGIIQTTSDVMKLQFKKNVAELLNVAEDAERKAEEARQRQEEAEQKRHEDFLTHEREKFEKTMEYEKYKFDEEQKTRKYISDNDHRKFQLQADSDENKVPDVVQSAEVRKELAIEVAKIQQDTKREEMASKERIANQKNK